MRTKQIEAGCPVVLQCVVSDPDACVYWYKEEMQLTSNSGLEILSDGNTRTLIIQSAELHHSGLYRCTTQDDVIEFQVEIKGDFALLLLRLLFFCNSSPSFQVPLTIPASIIHFDGLIY